MTREPSAPGIVAARGPLAPARHATIDLDAFRHNVRTLAAIAAPAETMIAVKADAYGHGMVPIARAALEAGASSLAVLDIPAALRLRTAGIRAPLFAWLHGLDSDFGAAAAADVDLGVSTLWQLEAIVASRGEARPRIHLKVDTGLSRNGATAEEWPGLVRAAQRADRAGHIVLHALWSHLADASPEDDAAALTRFLEAVSVAEAEGATVPLLHLAASSAGLRMPAARFGMVRFGIAAYGISPFDDETGADLGLRPVMTVTSAVASVKRVSAGHGVSYGLTYRTSRESTLALVPLGYADGVPRVAGPVAAMALNGRRYPIAGRVAMDQVVLDVGDDEVSVGDAVTMFGSGRGGEPTAEEWAAWAKTIGDEIVARVGPRVERVYRGEAIAVDTSFDTQASDDVTDTTVVERATLSIAAPEDMTQLGHRLAARLTAGDLVVLTGRLGAGKTTLTRGIGDGLGVRGPITSPTFVLARTHPSTVGGPPLVHVDAYRLSSPAELDDLDIDFAHSVVVVEWGRGLVENITDAWIEVDIDRPSGAPADGSPAGAAADGDRTDADPTGDPNDLSVEPVEPRTVTVTAVGARWSGLAASLADAAS